MTYQNHRTYPRKRRLRLYLAAAAAVALVIACCFGAVRATTGDNDPASHWPPSTRPTTRPPTPTLLPPVTPTRPAPTAKEPAK